MFGSSRNKGWAFRFRVLATSGCLWRAGSVGAVALALSAVSTTGCLKLLTEKPLEPGSYGSTQPELLRLWQDVLEAAKHDDREKLTELMSSMRMSQDELATLVGEDKARRFWPRYELLARPLGPAGAAELVGSIYEHHYDDVEVTLVDSLPPDKLSESELGIKKALLQPTPFYRVRVIKKGTPYAIRYDFFVYQHGFWRTGRDLGKFLDPPKIVPLANPSSANPSSANPSSAGQPAASPVLDGGQPAKAAPQAEMGIPKPGGDGPRPDGGAPASPQPKAAVKTKSPG